MSLQEFLPIRKYDDDERELKTNDSVRKFQIEYNNDVLMVPEYPEGMMTEGVCLPKKTQSQTSACNDAAISNYNQIHEVAPGEGKVPIDLVYCKDWDAKAFPMLFPDSNNHLFDKRRERKLRDQDFFCQRLFNVDPRWRKNTHWIFSATSYRGKKRLQLKY